MVWGHVSHELANLGFQALLTLGAFLCFQLFKRFFPRTSHRDDDTYIIVDTLGRKFTVTLKFDCSPEHEQDGEQAKQLESALNSGN